MGFNEVQKHRFIFRFWLILLTPVFVLLVLFSLISFGFLGYMPTFEDLENPKSNLASEIITEDGQVLGQYFFKENRSEISYNELSPNVVNALIATEDIRYYKHSGIDFKGLFRVFFKTLLLGNKDSGGGSTITQQLAKQLFHDRPRSIFTRIRQKLNEWVIAVKLERRYTKEEIIALYLNQFDFINNAVGIKTAARVYFDKSPDSLRLEEAAVLIGMLKNPTLFNPVRRPDTSVYRRNVVLYQLYRYDYINRHSFDSLRHLPLTLNFRKVDHNEGVGTYFREYIRMQMTAGEPQRKDYFNYTSYQEDSIAWQTNPLYGWCNKNLKPDGTPYNLYRDGLKIYSTINYDLQRYSEEAMAEHLSGKLQPAFDAEKKGKWYAPFSRQLKKEDIARIMDMSIRRSERYRVLREAGASDDSIKRSFSTPVEMTVFSWKGDIDTVMSPLDSIRYYKKFLRSGLISIDPQTGYVRAYVGGISMKHFKYDHVAVSKNQVGSTFKPFLYILAMQEGYSPCDKVLVAPTTFQVLDSTWTPHTTCQPEFLNTYQTLKWGLANSENYISAWLLKKFHPERIVEMAYKMGIDSPIEAVPSIIYGVSDISVCELVGAYSTFANKGVHIDPLMITRIEDKHGNVLATFTSERTEAISEQTAYLMINLMEGVVNFGTAGSLRWRYGLTAQMAGKTGTTNDFTDGWYVGLTPNLVTGIWVGGEERPVRFDSWLGQGSSMALPIFGLYMQKVYANGKLGVTPEDVFERPENFMYSLNCEESAVEDEFREGFSEFDDEVY